MVYEANHDEIFQVDPAAGVGMKTDFLITAKDFRKARLNCILTQI
jgi:hypothetical protein